MMAQSLLSIKAYFQSLGRSRVMPRILTVEGSLILVFVLQEVEEEASTMEVLKEAHLFLTLRQTINPCLMLINIMVQLRNLMISCIDACCLDTSFCCLCNA